MIPQILLIILLTMGLTIDLVKHGEKKEKKYNAWITLISTVILTLLLYWGGFWKSLLN